MSLAIDANVLVRLLVRDDKAQYTAAWRPVEQASAQDEPVLIVLGNLLATEWMLRRRYKLERADMAGAFIALLESSDVVLEHPPTVEEALAAWAKHPSADFADCLLSARAAHLGRSRFMSFDVSPARFPGV